MKSAQSLERAEWVKCISLKNSELYRNVALKAVKVLPTTVSAEPERLRRFEQEACGSPRALFEMHVFMGLGAIASYDVTPDGQRFLIDSPIESRSPGTVNYC